MAVRETLLRGLAAHLHDKRADAADLVKTISALRAVRNDVPSGPDDGAINHWADDQVLEASPRLTASLDEDGMNNSQMAQEALVGYFARQDVPPSAHQLLRRMAGEDGAALSAFEAVMALNDPADLDFLGATLAQLSGLVWGSYILDIGRLAQQYGARAAPMLRVVATTGKDFNLRQEAAISLMTMGQPGGEPTMEAALHSTYWVERRQAARALDGLVTRHVPLGSLAHDCAGPDPSDPCGAKLIVTPPGMCEPHFACKLTPRHEIGKSN